jgi:formate C-acetyltransferase
MTNAIDHIPPSARALRLKERLLESPYEIDIERAGFYTDVWRRTEGTPSCMRAALAFEETLRKMSININDDELLVGVKTAKRLAGVLPVERGDFNTVLELELDRLTSRERHPFLINSDERRRLENDILPYWRGRTVRSRKIESWKKAGISRTRFLGPGNPQGPQDAGRAGRSSAKPRVDRL